MMQSYVLDFVCLLQSCLLFLMSAHDGCSHDEESNVSYKDEQNWSNEGPDEMCGGIQITAVMDDH